MGTNELTLCGCGQQVATHTTSAGHPLCQSCKGLALVATYPLSALRLQLRSEIYSGVQPR